MKLRKGDAKSLKILQPVSLCAGSKMLTLTQIAERRQQAAPTVGFALLIVATQGPLVDGHRSETIPTL